MALSVLYAAYVVSACRPFYSLLPLRVVSDPTSAQVAEIRQRALTYAEEKKTELEIEADLAHIKDAFARLRDEAIGDQVRP